MKFRPCIDIHNGKVKQIVGGSLQDAGSRADENFVSERPASYFAGLYREDGLTGGHVILLNKNSTDLLKKVNEALAKALAANLYDGWYNDAKALAGISTAAEVSYNDDGTAPSN